MQPMWPSTFIRRARDAGRLVIHRSAPRTAEAVVGKEPARTGAGTLSSSASCGSVAGWGKMRAVAQTQASPTGSSSGRGGFVPHSCTNTERPRGTDVAQTLRVTIETRKCPRSRVLRLGTSSRRACREPHPRRLLSHATFRQAFSARFHCGRLSVISTPIQTQRVYVQNARRVGRPWPQRLNRQFIHIRRRALELEAGGPESGHAAWPADMSLVQDRSVPPGDAGHL
jgi:hypothetical protein